MSEVRCPFRPAFHGTVPNDLLQFGYIEHSISLSVENHVLRLYEDHSDCKWSLHVTTSLLRLLQMQTSTDVLFLSNQNRLWSMVVLIRRLESFGWSQKIYAGFIISRFPTVTGQMAAWRVSGKLLSVFWSVESKLNIQSSGWTDLLFLVQSNLKQAPLSRCGLEAPFIAFMGRELFPAIFDFSKSEKSTELTITKLKRERSFNGKELQEPVTDLHPDVKNTFEQNCVLSRKSASEGLFPNFSCCDFVLVASAVFSAVDKL